MDSIQRKKLIIMNILDILKKYTDEDHRLSQKEIAEKLRSTLGLGVKVHLVNPKSIARSEGKAQRVIDNRKI